MARLTRILYKLKGTYTLALTHYLSYKASKNKVLYNRKQVNSKWCYQINKNQQDDAIVIPINWGQLCLKQWSSQNKGPVLQSIGSHLESDA